MTEAGFPHSGTCGSSRARRSPQHFAVRRALHRLLAPRHPPAALCSLIFHSVALPKECRLRSSYSAVQCSPQPRNHFRSCGFSP